MNAHALLDRLLAPGDAEGRILGVVIGIVTDNHDPEAMHRVKVHLPWLASDSESHWARVVSLMAGDGRGLYFLPEVGDEVLVAFEHGSVEHAYVLGALWNGKDAPPETNAGGKNDNRTIKSRSGHIVRFCDGAGEERVEIIDRTGTNRLVITSADNSIAIEARGDIVIASQTGKVTIRGMGVEIASSLDVKIGAQTGLDVTATGQANIRGAIVNIN